MADKIRENIENMLYKIKYFEKKEFLTEDEIRKITQDRENLEYRMIKNKSKKIDFLESINYEMNLENTRRQKVSLKKKYQECHLDYQYIKRIILLFDRLMKRYKNDYKLIKEYMKFCIQINSSKQLYKVFLKNLKYFAHNIEYWLIVIYFEFNIKKNIFKARELFHKAVGLNKKDFGFLIEFLFFEFYFIEFVHEREAFVNKLLLREKNEGFNDDKFVNSDSKKLQNLNKKIESEKKEENKGDIRGEMIKEIEGDNDEEEDFIEMDITDEEIDEDKLNQEFEIINKMKDDNDFEWIIKILEDVICFINNEKSVVKKEKYKNKLKEMILFLEKKKISVLKKYLEELKIIFKNEYNEIILEEEQKKLFNDLKQKENLKEFLRGKENNEMLLILLELNKNDENSLKIELLNHLFLKINFFDISLDLFKKKYKNLIELLELLESSNFSIKKNTTFLKLIWNNRNDFPFYNLYIKFIDYFDDKNEIYSILQKILKNNKNNKKFSVGIKKDFFSYFLQNFLLQNINDYNFNYPKFLFLIKIISLDKNLLFLFTEFLIPLLKNRTIESSLEKKITKKLIGFKNYCPLNIIIYYIDTNEKILNNNLFERYLLFKNDVELWKKYLSFCLSKNDFNNLNKIYSRIQKNFEDEDLMNLNNYYNEILNQ